MTPSEFRFLQPPSIRDEVQRAFEELAAGKLPSDVESAQLDIKEEAGRRVEGKIIAISPQSKPVARQIADEVACMANSPGGGALVIGLDDKTGLPIGAVTDAAWLAKQVYDLLDRTVTPTIEEAEFRGSRVLVVFVAESPEPVPFKGEYKHRVGDNCVAIDRATLTTAKYTRDGRDPSMRRSDIREDSVQDGALAALRKYARSSGHNNLASAATIDLLARLGLRDEDGWLNEAGAILLRQRTEPALTYYRRSVPGSSSTDRVISAGSSLVEQLAEVEAALTRNNPVVDLDLGFAVRRESAIPARPIREAIINGICHRDWSTQEPTVVEHVGDQIRVTSPGALVYGVTPRNILHHLSTPRYRGLAGALQKIGVAEREGVGIDRIFGDMVRNGHPLPQISEPDGKSVLVVLSGGPPRKAWVELFDKISPDTAVEDVDLALCIYRTSDGATPWISVTSTTDLLQRSASDAASTLERIAANYHYGTSLVFKLVEGLPPGSPKAWALTKAAASALSVPKLKTHTIALGWAAERGRVSSTECVSLYRVSPVTAGTQLQRWAEEGLLVPSSPTGKGHGLHYTLPSSDPVLTPQ